MIVSAVRRTVLTALAAALAASLLAPVADGYNAKIRETRYGIPHVKAHNWGSGGYGVGFAFAKQNLCTFADDIVTLRARRSQIFGPDGETPQSASASVNNVDSDLFWQWIIDSHRVEDLLDAKGVNSPSRAARKLVRGYAAGYNAYIAAKGGVDSAGDPRCRGKGVVMKIKPIDIWRRIYQADLIASAQNFIPDIDYAAPPGSGGSSADAMTPDEAADAIAGSPYDQTDNTDEDFANIGSNALAVGPQYSRNGNTMLLANPHFPWRGTERFWEFQLTVPGKINVMGASLFGFPLVNIGHNENVAWSHTVSTAMRFTLFELKLDPADPTRYLYDGQSLPMEKQTVTIPVDDGSTRTATIWTSRFGPVLARPSAGIGWTTTTAYALGDANDHIRSADSFLAMNQAKSARDLIEGQSKYQGIPWVNTIAVDDSGRALYADNSVVPNVTKEKIDTCIPAGLSQVIYNAAGIIPLDGSTSACGWGNDPDAAVDGIFGPSNLPIQFRKDYELNANDSYWLANAKAPLTGFSPIIGCENCEQGLRTRLGHEMVDERMAATDGLSRKPKFTLSNLQDMWLADRSLGAELTSDGLAEICRSNPVIGGVDVTEACPIIEAYNDSARLDSPGGWLFNVWWQIDGSSDFWSDSFDPANPLTTPRVMNTSSAGSIAALGEAVQNLRDHDIPLDASYGDVQRAFYSGDPIPIHGCSTGCWQAIYSPVDDSSSFPYGVVGAGSSTVQFTEFKKNGPTGNWILTYSQSEAPGNAHNRDQTKRFSKSKLVPMRFTGAEIRSDPKLRVYSVGSGG